MGENKEVAKIVDLNPEVLIAKAIEKNVPVETMEKLLAMRDKLKKEWAEEQFYKALAGFQSECPTIKKTKIVKDKNGKVRYRYAPLESIIEQVKDLLKAYNFSYTIQSRLEDGQLIVTCELHHKDGHSKSSEFRVPIYDSNYMNNIQKYASSLTYAKRYAFCNATGIMTGDEDNDGQLIEEKPSENPLNKPHIIRDKHAKVIADEILLILDNPIFPPDFVNKTIDWLNSKQHKAETLIEAKHRLVKMRAQLEAKQAEPEISEDIGDEDLQGVLVDVKNTEGNAEV